VGLEKVTLHQRVMRCASQQAVSFLFTASLRGSIANILSEVEGRCFLAGRLVRGSACKKKGYPPHPKLRGARMFAVVFLIVIALVLSYTAYLIWYAKSGRYDFDQRFDSITKR